MAETCFKNVFRSKIPRQREHGHPKANADERRRKERSTSRENISDMEGSRGGGKRPSFLEETD